MSSPSRPPKVPRPTPVPRVVGPLDRREGPAALTWWQQHGSPHVERIPGTDDVLATFTWVDDESHQVLLWVNRLTDETDLAATMLRRVAGTPLWTASFRMPATWRASYVFLTAPCGEEPPWLVGDQVALRDVLDRGLADPGNPERSFNRAGVAQSVVAGPDAPGQPWFTTSVVSEAGPVTAVDVDGTPCWIHEPPGTDTSSRLPLTVVLDGEAWVDAQGLPKALDAMHAAGALSPRRTLFVSSGGRRHRWDELGDAVAGPALVVEGIVPWARSTLPVVPGGAPVTVVGQSLGGLTALRAGLRAPEVVGRVASQSASLWQDDLAGELGPARRRGGVVPTIHLAHGSEEWVLRSPHERLASRLREAEVPHWVAAYCGGHDYAWWRGAVCDALVRLDQDANKG